MRATSAQAKSSPGLKSVIAATKKLWRQHHLTYDQTHYVAKEVRCALAIERPKTRKRVVARLSREEECKLIAHAYRVQGTRGLLIKTLFQTGARVSEFVNIQADEVFFEEQMMLIAKAKGGKSRYVPILPQLAEELRTHLGHRTTGVSLRDGPEYAVFAPAHPADHQGDRSRCPDHQAGLPGSAPPLRGDDAPGAGHAHRADPEIPGALQAGDHPDLCGVERGDDQGGLPAGDRGLRPRGRRFAAGGEGVRLRGPFFAR